MLNEAVGFQNLVAMLAHLATHMDLLGGGRHGRLSRASRQPPLSLCSDVDVAFVDRGTLTNGLAREDVHNLCRA